MDNDNPDMDRLNRIRENRRARNVIAEPYPPPINPRPAFPPNLNFAPRPPLLPRNRQAPLLNAPLPPQPGPQEPIVIDRDRIVPSRTQILPIYQIHFPLGTRVGVIEFISPTGVSEWLDSSGFTVVIGNVLRRQNQPRFNNLRFNNQFREQAVDIRPVENADHPQPDQQNANEEEERVERNQIMRVQNNVVPLRPVAPEEPLRNEPVNQIGGNNEDILPPARDLNAPNNIEPVALVAPVEQPLEIEPDRAAADNQVLNNLDNNIPDQSAILNPQPNAAVSLDALAPLDNPVLFPDQPMDVNDDANHQNDNQQMKINLPAADVAAVVESHSVQLQEAPVPKSSQEIILPAAKVDNSAPISIHELGESSNVIDESKDDVKSIVEVSGKHKADDPSADRPKKKKKKMLKKTENVLSPDVSPAHLQKTKCSPNKALAKVQPKKVYDKKSGEYDLFCWICHRPQDTHNKLSNRRCECGLICHDTCGSNMFPQEAPLVAGISPATGQQKTVDLSYMVGKCVECMHIEAGAAYNREFGFDLTEAGIVFTYASVRLADDMKFICFKNLHANPHVVRPMDLKIITTKAENGAYRSTEEFIFDIKLAIHNAHIIKETTAKVYDYITLGEELLKAAKEEFVYLNMCSSCYRNYYEIKEKDSLDFGFDFPCDSPHGLVWAMKENHWFPAKVYEYRAEGTFVTSQELVSVIFFGSGKSSPIQVNPNLLYMYSKNFPTPQSPCRGKARSLFSKAQRIAIQYLKHLDNFFTHNYQVPDNAAAFDWEEIFISVGESKDRDEVLKAVVK